MPGGGAESGAARGGTSPAENAYARPRSGEDAKRKSYLRWTDKALRQMGFVNNLLITLGGAGLAFGVNLLLDEKFKTAPWVMVLLTISLAAVLVSIAFGLWCAFVRLKDYRETRRLARMRWKPKPGENVETQRDLVDLLDERTWPALKIQLWAFFVGVMGMTVALILHKFLSS